MTFLAIILGYGCLYWWWDARAYREVWMEAETECDELKQALYKGGELVAEADRIVNTSMSTIVNLARAHTIICDLHGEDVEEGIREMCGREYDKYVDDEWM